MLPLGLCLLSYIWQIFGYVTHRGEEDEDKEEVSSDFDKEENEEDESESISGEEFDQAVDEILKKQGHK
jgi:hypothetical protein